MTKRLLMCRWRPYKVTLPSGAVVGVEALLDAIDSDLKFKSLFENAKLGRVEQNDLLRFYAELAIHTTRAIQTILPR